MSGVGVKRIGDRSPPLSPLPGRIRLRWARTRGRRSGAALSMSNIVPPLGIPGTCTDFANQPTFNERYEAGPGGACRAADMLGYVARRPSLSIVEQREDGLIDCVEIVSSLAFLVEPYSEVDADLLERWLFQSRVSAGRDDPLNTASPLFDESKLVKNPADGSVA